MIINLIGYITYPRIIDIDDSPFTSELLNIFRNKILNEVDQNIKVVKNKELFSESYNLKTGYGIRVDYSESKRFISEMLESYPEYLDDDDLAEEISNKNIKEVFIDIFSLGTALFTLKVDLKNDKPENTLDIIMSIALAIIDEESNIFKKFISKTLYGFYDSFKNISILSEIYKNTNDDFKVYFPGLLPVIQVETNRIYDRYAEQAKKFQNNSNYKEIIYDEDNNVFIGNSIVIMCCDNTIDDNGDEILSALLLSQLYEGIIESATSIFSNLLLEETIRSIKNDKPLFGDKSINKLNALSTAIIDVTNFHNTAWDSDNRLIFDTFEEVEGLNKARDNFIFLSQKFVEIQAKYNQDVENRFSRRLNFTVLILTTLTFISVISDIISSVDYSQSLIPYPDVRFMLLTIPPLLILVLVYLMVFRKSK